MYQLEYKKVCRAEKKDEKTFKNKKERKNGRRMLKKEKERKKKTRHTATFL